MFVPVILLVVLVFVLCYSYEKINILNDKLARKALKLSIAQQPKQLICGQNDVCEQIVCEKEESFDDKLIRVREATRVKTEKDNVIYAQLGEKGKDFKQCIEKIRKCIVECEGKERENFICRCCKVDFTEIHFALRSTMIEYLSENSCYQIQSNIGNPNDWSLCISWETKHNKLTSWIYL